MLFMPHEPSLRVRIHDAVLVRSRCSRGHANWPGHHETAGETVMSAAVSCADWCPGREGKGGGGGRGLGRTMTASWIRTVIVHETTYSELICGNDITMWDYVHRLLNARVKQSIAHDSVRPQVSKVKIFPLYYCTGKLYIFPVKRGTFAYCCFAY